MAMRTEGAMQAPQIVRGVYSVDSASGAADVVPATMPTGVWVDRIPNARGKALAPAIAAAAQRYGLDPAFLAAVFWTESSYTPDVVSRTGAIGLGQLMPETAQWLGVDPWDPMQNIDGSARFYKQLIDNNHGDMSLAIASYAAGPGAVKRAGGIPDQFTADYVTKLLARTDYLAGRRSTAP
jgi:soluble lytic murein transglycosylase-like protein